VFTYQGVKIAVEYDEWYYHGHKIAEDEKRYHKLVRDGWKIIVIRAHRNIPTKQQIDSAIAKIISGAKRVTIKLPKWGVGTTLADRHKKVEQL